MLIIDVIIIIGHIMEYLILFIVDILWYIVPTIHTCRTDHGDI